MKPGVGRKLPIHCGHLPKYGLSTSLSWMQRLVWSSALLSLGRLTQMVGLGKYNEHQRIKLFTVFSGSVTMCLLVNLPVSHGLLHLWRFGGPCCNATQCDMQNHKDWDPLIRAEGKDSCNLPYCSVSRRHAFHGILRSAINKEIKMQMYVKRVPRNVLQIRTSGEAQERSNIALRVFSNKSFRLHVFTKSHGKSMPLLTQSVETPAKARKES